MTDDTNMKESPISGRGEEEVGGYANFDLVIEKNNGGYRALAKGPYGGEAQGLFTSPLNAQDFEALADRLDRSRATRTRRIETPQLSLAKEMGGRLHTAVMSPEIRTALARAMDAAERDGLAGVRIRLDLSDAPDLAVLPWEFLFDADPRVGRFLALADESPLVRYLPLPDRSRPLTVTPPLRLLAVVSSPADDRYAELDVEREWSLLQEALAQPIQEGLLKLERLPRATVASLADALQSGEPHILHFIGHGRFDEDHQDGVLAFEGERGGAHEVSAEHLGTLLYNERSLRLVVLNACEGGRASATDPYAGMAQTLVRMRIPAVVAMQYEITDRAAILFARQFYRGLAAGRTVDTAITDARLAVFSQVSDLEWATPVLYMRAPDGRIFDVVARDATASDPHMSSTPSPGRDGAAIGNTPSPAASPVVAAAAGTAGPGTVSTTPSPVVRSVPPITAAGSSDVRGVAAGVIDTSRIDPLGPQLPPFWTRVVAYLIDVFAVAFAVAIVELLLDETLPVNIAWFAYGAYFAFFWSSAGNGQTLGMRAFRLRVVRTDGTALDIGRALLRVVGLGVSLVAFGIGLIWAAFDKKQRAWHDMLADTKVIRVDR